MIRRALLFGFFATICVQADDRPHRIVSLSPDITEMLYGIGAFAQVAGVTDYCTYPPEVKRLPRVGGWENPSLEKLAALRPDLVVSDEAQAFLIEDKLKALGLRMMIVPDRSIQDVYTTMELLGRATGHEIEAAKLIASTREHLVRVSQKTSGLRKPTVVIIVDRTPGTLNDLYTVTDKSFLAELITIAGGRIIAPKDARGYGKLSKEDLMAANPDIILDFAHGAPNRLTNDPIEPWREMPELRAVKTHQVHAVNEDFVPHASQRMVQTAELFARLLHPELK